jgi:hypothetical protein
MKELCGRVAVKLLVASALHSLVSFYVILV